MREVKRRRRTTRLKGEVVRPEWEGKRVSNIVGKRRDD